MLFVVNDRMTTANPYATWQPSLREGRVLSKKWRLF